MPLSSYSRRSLYNNITSGTQYDSKLSVSAECGPHEMRDTTVTVLASIVTQMSPDGQNDGITGADVTLAVVPLVRAILSALAGVCMSGFRVRTCLVAGVDA